MKDAGTEFLIFSMRACEGSRDQTGWKGEPEFAEVEIAAPQVITLAWMQIARAR
jgi:hypothetical protein